MNYSFEFNSPAIGKIQPFEYSYATTNEYAFTYDRDIFSDLSKYNAPIFVARKRRGFFSYNKNLIATRISNSQLGVNHTEKNGIISSESLSLFEQKTIKKLSSNLNVLNDTLLTNKELYLEVFKDFLLHEYQTNFDYQTGFFLNNYTPKKIIIADLIQSKKYFTLDVYDNYFLEEPINNLSIPKTYSLKQKDKKQTSIKGDMFLNKEIQLSVFNEIFAKEKYSPELYINKDYMLFRDKRQTFLNKEINCAKPDNIISLFKDITVKKKYQDSISVGQAITIKAIAQKQVQQFNPIIIGNLPNKNCAITDKLFYCKLESGNTSYSNKIMKLAKYKKRLLKSKDIVLGYHPKRKVCFRKENLFVYKFDKNLFLGTDVHLSKKRNGFVINDTNIIIKKELSRFDVNTDNIYLKKQRKGFVIAETQTLLDKKKIGFAIDDSNVSFYRNSYGFRIHEDIIMSNTSNSFVIDDSSTSIYKDRYSSSIYTTEANLSNIDIPVTMDIHSNTIGFIVSAKSAYKHDDITTSKKRNYIFKNDTADFISKEKYNSVYNNYSLFTFTKEKEIFLNYYHPLMVSENLKNTLLFATEEFIAKDVKDAIIYDNNINIVKSLKDAFISIDTSLFISAELKKIIPSKDAIFITKNNKHSFLSDTTYFINKKFKYSDVNHIDTWVHKNYQHSNLFSNEQINKQIYEAFIYDNDIVIDKLKKGIYDSNHNMFAERERKGVEISNSQTQITEKRKGFNVNEEYLFITRDQYEMNPFVSQLAAMKKIVKELEKPVEKTYNWAYVHQYEDPIDPNYDYYGIDELLLPKKDVKYETFEDAIFDKKAMKPKKPIKILDNNTFIAKYPIKHPIINYEEIGIDYVDIPAELMHKIFIKFYQIWYANIFKFGNMSMVDSLKLMLEYTYAHIITVYGGTESLEPALRVFRQIRWFGETSVMHNAQYKITCEYEDLKSDLQTGNCNIKNVLNGFEVDKKLKVLSSTPTTFGSEAYIKLYTENQEDTQISFSISFVGGQVEILLNGDLIDIITSNRATVAYELPATDDENEFIIRRASSSNIGYCYVGNIIVKNGAYKNLNIEYDPDLKAGNMPLNDVVNKMVILANMYDNEQEAFEQFRKGNLAISELYKKLETYWELHHANKAKGKRLTIKET